MALNKGTIRASAVTGRRHSNIVVYVAYATWLLVLLDQLPFLVLGETAAARLAMVGTPLTMLIVCFNRRFKDLWKLRICATCALVMVTVNWAFILTTYNSVDRPAFAWMIGVAVLTYALCVVSIRAAGRVAAGVMRPLTILAFIGGAALVAACQVSIEYGALGGMFLH